LRHRVYPTVISRHNYLDGYLNTLRTGDADLRF